MKKTKKRKKLTQQRRGPSEPDADGADQRRLPGPVGPDDEVESRPRGEVDGVAVGLRFFMKRRRLSAVSVENDDSHDDDDDDADACLSYISHSLLSPLSLPFVP